MEISPSVLGVNPKKWNIPVLEKYCERLHIDIVPEGLTPGFVRRIKTQLVKDIHLMVDNVEKGIERYSFAGIINFHIEAGNTLNLIMKARSLGVKVGLSVNPETRVKALVPFLGIIDEVLLMSVHPGRSGRKFINIAKKIRQIRKLNKAVIIKVDGGLNNKTVKKIRRADIAVMGAYIFRSRNIEEVLRRLSLMHVAKELRKSVIRMVSSAKSGHPAGSLGMADVFAVLFFDAMKYDPANPEWKKRDYLVLSNGHICPVLYACMARAGFFPKAELLTLRKLGSRLQGHPHRSSLPGLESTSGPLGIGLSQAAGMALALKMDKKDNRVFCITSDGEHDEGNTWEAVMFAPKYSLNNLVCIIDKNNIQLSGNTNEIMPLGNLKKKYKAFGWKVKVVDGHDMKKIKRALAIKSKKPLAIIANTIPGRGVSFMENKWEWHGKAPNDEESVNALNKLGRSAE
jgi:transketolase